MTTLYIVRGLPGSGKSTLGMDIVSNSVNTTLIEADQFFLASNGYKEVYSFDRRFLGAAHDECYGRTMRALRNGKSVVVANTFSTQREVERYLKGLKRTGLRIEAKIIKCVGEWKSPHNVPSRAIEKMRTRWEDIEGEVVYDPTAE